MHALSLHRRHNAEQYEQPQPLNTPCQAETIDVIASPLDLTFGLSIKRHFKTDSFFPSPKNDVFFHLNEDEST